MRTPGEGCRNLYSPPAIRTSAVKETLSSVSELTEAAQPPPAKRGRIASYFGNHPAFVRKCEAQLKQILSPYCRGLSLIRRIS